MHRVAAVGTVSGAEATQARLPTLPMVGQHSPLAAPCAPLAARPLRAAVALRAVPTAAAGQTRWLRSLPTVAAPTPMTPTWWRWCVGWLARCAWHPAREAGDNYSGSYYLFVRPVCIRNVGVLLSFAQRDIVFNALPRAAELECPSRPRCPTALQYDPAHNTAGSGDGGGLIHR